MTDPDADLTAFKDMPLEISRFVGSNLVSDEEPEIVLAALMLWCASWHQRPAGSLSIGDKYLAKAAGYGRVVDAWMTVRDRVLRGWIECSDGRLYHPVVAEKVKAAWTSRLKQMHRTYGSAVRMHNSRSPNDKRDALTFEDWLEQGRPDGVKRADRPAPRQDELPLPHDEANDDGGDNSENGDCYAQQGAALRATEADVARLDSTKGREGKGREGKGYISTSSPLPPATPAEADDDGAKPTDLTAIAGRFARAGGVSLNPAYPKPYTRELDLVKGWIADLIPEDLILSTITAHLEKTAEESVGSFKFYDGAIRKAFALANRKRGVDPAKHKPLAKVSASDDADDRIPKIREAVSHAIGTRSYGAWLDPSHAAMRINGVGLVVKVRSDFHVAQVTQFADQLEAAARSVGVEGIRITK